MLRTRLSTPDLAGPALPARWQALAAAARAPAFLSWAWIGCLVPHLDDPLLAEAFDGDDLVGLALFNRRGTALHLHSTGDPALDSVFIEHNGAVATHPGAFAAILQAIRPQASRVVLPGLDDAGLQVVRGSGGITIGLHTRPAPFVALDPGRAYVDQLSRNARAQLRRSDRSYAAAGPIVAERAATPACALDWLEAMLPLHAATWSRRGVASGFLTAPVQGFVRDLVRRGVPDGVIDLLRVTAGRRHVGTLLNLVESGRVLSYQGGFDYAGAGPHEKPGLTCHHAAIEHARAAGACEYDFLAGEARYKRSLSTGARALHWLTWKPRPPLFGVEALVRQVLRRP